MILPMATSIRLPDPLKAEAAAYAASAGVSLNGLVCLALRQYLDALPQRAPGSDGPASTSLSVAVGSEGTPGQGLNREQKRAALKKKR